MNIEKYKSVAIHKDTYDKIRVIAKEDYMTINNFIRKLVDIEHVKFRERKKERNGSADQLKLPESPIKKVYECRKCKRVSVKFYDPKYNTSYTKDEWDHVLQQGSKALDTLLEMYDPKFFSQKGGKMFHLWHVLAILGVFVLGFFYGRWSMKLWFEIKKEEWQNKIESEKLAKEKENMEWAARRH